MSFYATVTNYNGPLATATAQARIHVATHLNLMVMWATLVRHPCWDVLVFAVIKRENGSDPNRSMVFVF